MPVVRVYERGPGREGRFEEGGALREYVRSFRVTTNDPKDDADVVRYAEGMPRLFDGHPKDPASRVKAVRPRQHGEENLVWDCEVEYSTKIGTPPKGDPFERQTKIRWGSEQFETAVQRDLNGVAIANSAGDLFDPPITIDDSRPTLEIERPQISFDPQVKLRYGDAVNSDYFFGYAPTVVKCKTIDAVSAFEPEIGDYWIVTYSFHLKRGGWRKFLIDRGFNQIVYVEGKGNTKAKILDDYGQPLSVPALLDGKGKKLAVPAAGQWVEPFIIGGPSYIVQAKKEDEPILVTGAGFVVYREIPFAPLNLP